MIRLAPIAVLCAWLAAPAAASAHAVLEESAPQRGAALERAPGEVVLRFNEPVEAAFGAVRVYDAGGEQVQEGEAYRPEGDSRRVAVRLPDSLAGGYTVTYRVISADSHPVAGGFVFAVGEGAAAGATVDELLRETRAGPVSWNALSVARGVQYGAIAVGLGAVVFLLVSFGPALAAADTGAGAAAPPFARRSRLIVLAAGGAGALSAAAAVVLQGAVASATSFWESLSPDTLGAILETRFGTVWGLAALAWLAVLGLAAAGALRLTALPLAGLAFVPGLGGHAAVEDPTWLLLPANVVHVGAMSAWLGGIAMLVLGVRAATRAVDGADRTRLLAGVLMRFSGVAGLAVLALLATGIAQSVVHVESFGNLLDTAFGRAVLVKVALFAAMVALGWVNRRRLLPRLARAAETGAAPGRAGLSLRRVLRTELALGAVVIGATAALASYQPSSTVGAGPYSTDFTLGPARAEVTLDPAEVGSNEIHLYLFDRRTGAQYDRTKELVVRASLPEKEIAPIDLEPQRAGPGHYVVPRAVLGVRGDWRLEVSARVSKFDQYDGSFDVPVE